MRKMTFTQPPAIDNLEEATHTKPDLDREAELDLHFARCGATPRVRQMLARGWNPEWRQIPEIFSTWEGEPQSLAIFGKAGRGKTHLAALVFERIAKQTFTLRCEKCEATEGFVDRGDGTMARCPCRDGRLRWPNGVLWIDVPDTVETLKATMGTPRYEQTLTAIRSSSLVVLDDVGTEIGEWGRELVPGWIRWRYNNMTPTIVTCNADSLADFRRYDARTASRLSEGLVREAGGVDRRPEVANSGRWRHDRRQ